MAEQSLDIQTFEVDLISLAAGPAAQVSPPEVVRKVDPSSEMKKAPPLLQKRNSVAQATSESPPSAVATDVESAAPQIQTSSIGGGGRSAATLEELYIAELTALIHRRKSYPLMAKKLNQQGRVKVFFTIGKNGQVIEARVVESSPYQHLNRSAAKLIEEINELKPLPAEINKSTLSFVVPINYRL